MERPGCLVELYIFEGEHITRYATTGLSSSYIDNTNLCNCELLLCVPNDIAISQTTNIENYIFDICAYLISTLGRAVTYQDLIPESTLAPSGWPKAILFDEPRGESEQLECFHVGEQHVNLLWIIPIYGDEYIFIKENGIGKFDMAAETLELSLVDVRRQSCVKNS